MEGGNSDEIASFFIILFCTIAGPAFGELTPQDLDKIRLIVKEEIEDEIKPMRAKIASLRGEIASIRIDIAEIRARLVNVEKQSAELAPLKDNVLNIQTRLDSVEK